MKDKSVPSVDRGIQPPWPLPPDQSSPPPPPHCQHLVSVLVDTKYTRMKKKKKKEVLWDKVPFTSLSKKNNDVKGKT